LKPRQDLVYQSRMKTSFGDMEILLKEGPKPRIEFLRFEKAGRPHRHNEYEYFFTTKGSGFVYVDEKPIAVTPGDLVKISPLSSHWMEPTTGTVLEGLLWYHETDLRIADN
jgi:mannose-6-phosphate isomerase-like protein (cupin superfamily)